MVWDASAGQLTLFGGFYDNGTSDVYSDTWVAPPAQPPSLIGGINDPELFPPLPGDEAQGLASDATRLYIGYDDTITCDPHGNGHIDIVTPNGRIAGRRPTPAGCWHPNDIKYDPVSEELVVINTDVCYATNEAACAAGCTAATLALAAWRLDARAGHFTNALPSTPLTPAGWHLASIALDGDLIWRGIHSRPTGAFQLCAFDSSGQVQATRVMSVYNPVQGSLIRDGFFWLATSSDAGDVAIIDKYRIDLDPPRKVAHWASAPATACLAETEGITVFRDRLVYSAGLRCDPNGIDTRLHTV